MSLFPYLKKTMVLLSLVDNMNDVYTWVTLWPSLVHCTYRTHAHPYKDLGMSLGTGDHLNSSVTKFKIL